MKIWLIHLREAEIRYAFEELRRLTALAFGETEQGEVVALVTTTPISPRVLWKMRAGLLLLQLVDGLFLILCNGLKRYVFRGRSLATSAVSILHFKKC